MDDINNAKLEILEVMESFIINPTDSKIHEDAIRIERKYASLTTLNDYLKKNVVPDYLVDAIAFMQEIYEFNPKSVNMDELVAKASDLKNKIKR